MIDAGQEDKANQGLLEIVNDPEAMRKLGEAMSKRIRAGIDYWHSLPLGQRIFGNEDEIMSEFYKRYDEVHK